jgi:hypothetical protein
LPADEGWPTTVGEAALRVVARLTAPERAALREMTYLEMQRAGIPRAGGLRGAFEIDSAENVAIFEDAGRTLRRWSVDPDDVWRLVVEEVWELVRAPRRQE